MLNIVFWMKTKRSLFLWQKTKRRKWSWKIIIKIYFYKKFSTIFQFWNRFHFVQEVIGHVENDPNCKYLYFHRIKHLVLCEETIKIYPLKEVFKNLVFPVWPKKLQLCSDKFVYQKIAKLGNRQRKSKRVLAI